MDSLVTSSVCPIFNIDIERLVIMMRSETTRHQRLWIELLFIWMFCNLSKLIIKHWVACVNVSQSRAAWKKMSERLLFIIMCSLYCLWALYITGGGKHLNHRHPPCSLSLRGSVTYLKLCVNKNQRFVLSRFGIRLVIWTWIVLLSNQKFASNLLVFMYFSSHGWTAS